jgi:hypothetical protein
MEQDPASRGAGGERPVGKAAFLLGVWVASAVVGLSVMGSAHARTVAGQAPLAFWIVVALVVAASSAVAVAFARLPRSGNAGAGRRVAPVLMAAAILLFLWETIVVGSGAALPAPSGLIARALGF